MTMRKLNIVIKKRLLEEWQDSEMAIPLWLARIVRDDALYIILVITVCANSFGMGLVLGMLVYI
jgi:hypothetical protein